MKTLLFFLFLQFCLFAQTLQLGVKTGPSLITHSKDLFPQIQLKSEDVPENHLYYPLPITGLSIEYNSSNNYGLNFEFAVVPSRAIGIELGINANYKFFYDLYGTVGVSYIFNTYTEDEDEYRFADINLFPLALGLGYEITNNISLSSTYYLFNEKDYFFIKTVNGEVLQNKLRSIIKFNFSYKFNLMQ